jgi:hypothetical protein
MLIEAGLTLKKHAPAGALFRPSSLFSLLRRHYALASASMRRLPGPALEKCDVGTAKKAAMSSTGECNTHAGIQFIRWCHKTQRFSGPLIQLQGDLV